MSKASKKEIDRAEAIKNLREIGIKHGSAIYTTITKVSPSRTSRNIRCYFPVTYTFTDPHTGTQSQKPSIVDITGLVAKACGIRLSRNGWDLVVGGWGMSFTFHVVYSLGRAMFPDGGPIEHSNYTRQVQAGEFATVETDGGYLLHKVDL